MTRLARPIAMTLTREEAAHLIGAVGDGGQQVLHKRLVDELNRENLTVRLTDAEIGQLIRYMTQYGNGGFQGRLRKAFQRPLLHLLGSTKGEAAGRDLFNG